MSLKSMINFYRGALVNSNIQYLCRVLCRIQGTSYWFSIGGGTRYLFWGVAYYVFPFSECLSHLQCHTKSNHLYSYTDLVTVTIYRLNKAYVWLICRIIGDLMGFYGGLAYPF